MNRSLRPTLEAFSIHGAAGPTFRDAVPSEETWYLHDLIRFAVVLRMAEKRAGPDKSRPGPLDLVPNSGRRA
jgi:hypothetical protein